MAKEPIVIFTTAKLGSKWRHKATGKIYELRRKTDPKTLEGTLYFWNRQDGDRIFKPSPEEWEPACTMTNQSAETSKPSTKTKRSRSTRKKPTS